MTINVKEFLARQLNDHSESPSGVVQKTFYEWPEQHLCDAIELGLCYLYSLLPQEFSTPQTLKNPTADCVIDFCSVCSKFMGVIDVGVDGQGCIQAQKQDGEVNNLMGLLDIGCVTGDDNLDNESYQWQVVDGTTCVVKFDREVPAGATIRYTCSTPPEDIDDLNTNKLCEYLPMVAEYALWWLFRTDSESRSNLDRARLHFEGLRDFVQNKLLLEFSLREDDYNYGRRKVDD